MKTKSLLLGLAASLIIGSVSAQIQHGGIPLSLSTNTELMTPNLHTFATPDFASYAKANDKKQATSYKVGLYVPTTLSFPESGVLTRNEDGRYIWQAKVKIADVKGLGFVFDEFVLPQGVSVYFLNSNKKQILGAFNSNNNNEHKRFVSPPIQGEEATIEVNIPQGIDIGTIKMTLQKTTAYFRGFDDLLYYSDDFNDYGTIDATDEWLFGRSSKCMINAVCPEGDGFEIPRQATVLLIIPDSATAGVGFCSGTLINNTGNSSTSCTKYILTATHCEGSNTTSNSSEAMTDLQVRFNFQQPTCEWTTAVPEAKYLDGVQFVARDPYDESAGSGDLDADFLLLKLNKLIPSTWEVTMAGWDRNPSHVLAYVPPKKFVGFHHPGGDVKKVTTAQSISNSTPYYWGVQYNKGYGAQGSSGSSLFDNEGESIGVASVATYGFVDGADSCLYTNGGVLVDNTSKRIWYAKNSYNWENPSLTAPTDKQKLKPWLDPANTGVMTLGPATASCQPLSIVSVNANNFNGDFTIYPNPSTSGKLQINIKMDENVETVCEVFDVMGKRVAYYQLPAKAQQIYNLDLSNVANGMYLIKISNDSGYITKRAVINK